MYTYVGTDKQFFNWWPVDTDAQMAPPGKSKYNYSSTSYMNSSLMTYKPSKLGQTDLVFDL